jgi:hypothetical protein
MTRQNRLVKQPDSGINHRLAQGDRERQVPIRNDLRASIAHSAARLIAEGLTDYQAAKKKAARQHGATDRHALPDNHEIELALREHFALFSGHSQPLVLSALRETAIRLMSRLEQFSPWLVGAVLNGTANEFSEIELELIGVEPKEFEIYLLNAGVDFELCDPPRATVVSSAQKSQPMKYRVEFDAAPVTIALYDQQATRQAANPNNSNKRDRALRADAERRFRDGTDKL